MTRAKKMGRALMTALAVRRRDHHYFWYWYHHV